MVATVWRLRAHLLRHTLRTERWRLILLVIGAVWCASMLPSLAGGVLFLTQQPDDVSGVVLVAFGAVLTVGWAVVPVLLPALDDSLDIRRFATFGVELRRLVPALLVAALLGVPTLFTAALTALPVLVWASRGPAPAIVALLAAPLALLTCVLVARLSTSGLTRVLGGRRSRELGAILGLLAVIGIGPAVLAVGSLGLEGAIERVPGVVEVLGWTPLGLPWAAPGAMAAGDAAGAVARLALAAGVVALAGYAWAALLRLELVSPPSDGARQRRRLDAILPGGRGGAATTGSAPGALRGLAAHPGWLAAEAVRRRAWRAWLTDPRYQTALVAGVVAPLMIMALAGAISSVPAAVALGLGPFAGASIGWGRHNDVAMDGSAVWLHVVSRVPGWADRWGRAAAALMWALPVTVVIALVGAWVAERPDLAPASVGAAVGLLCVGLAVSAVSSPVLPYPVPQAGSAPFAAELGSVGASLLAQVVTSLATALVGLPVIVLLALSLWWQPALAWPTLAVGVLGGAAVLAGGVRIGGRLFDTRGVWLLTRAA